VRPDVNQKNNSQNGLKTASARMMVALNLVQLLAYLKELRAENEAPPSLKKQLFIFGLFRPAFWMKS
jgi:hypothetical protein